MSVLEQLISPLQNCEQTAWTLCRALNVPITRTTLVNAIVTHPDYPSLLSLSDTFDHYGIGNQSLRIETDDRLSRLPTPFVAQVESRRSATRLFCTVYRVDEDQVEWQNPETNKRERIARKQFDDRFTRNVQLYYIAGTAGENGYPEQRKQERKRHRFHLFLICILPLTTLPITLLAFFEAGRDVLFPALYTWGTLSGSIVSALLMLYELNRHNPTLQKICRSNARRDCAAVLRSRGAQIAGIPWSAIGFSFFTGIWLVLLSVGIVHAASLSAAAWLSAAALPYIVYSVLYQALSVKQWCPLCLTVQGILLFLFIIAVSGGFLSLPLFSWKAFLPYFISITGVFIVLYVLLPTLEKAKFARFQSQKLQQLKHHPSVFEALLTQQKQLLEPTEGLGITLGNPAGKYHLIKVCNPYCGPCAKAHPIVDELLKKHPELRLQIIFTASEAVEDYRNRPVKTLLSLYRHASEQETIEALNRWYLAPEKEYESFAQIYPFDETQLDEHIEHIRSMREWCDKTQIEFTPTFFINGYQLPSLYSIRDLDYVFSSSFLIK